MRVRAVGMRVFGGAQVSMRAHGTPEHDAMESRDGNEIAGVSILRSNGSQLNGGGKKKLQQQWE